MEIKEGGQYPLAKVEENKKPDIKKSKSKESFQPFIQTGPIEVVNSLYSPALSKRNQKFENLNYFDNPEKQVTEFTSNLKIKNNINEDNNEQKQDEEIKVEFKNIEYITSTFCEEHQKEIIRFFCREEYCKLGICSACVEQHSTHDFIVANEVAAFEIKSEIKTALSRCIAKINSK